MVAPSAPLDLSADATNGTTIELRWLTPTDDGGSPITGYRIDRDLNDAGFVILVADTANTQTAYSDSTLAARDNAKYIVFAINGDGTSPSSDPSSATTATSEAQTIKELLFNNWSLTGELSNVVVGDMTEVVNFFDREQVPGNEESKAVEVQKINELGNENTVEHPKFFEQSDTFEITCKMQVVDSGTGNFSVWVDLMQQMTGEVTRILRTEYSPSTTTGEFFRTDIGWTKNDTYGPDEPVLVRILRFTLTRIVATVPEVFLGYGGVLVFDTSESSGDALPLGDYIYTEAYRVQTVQGWRNLPYITTDAPTDVAIPIYYRGGFGGQFSCQMYLKKEDIITGTLNSLSQIFLPQSNGELGTATFLQANSNTEDTPVVLIESVPVNITSIDKVSEVEELVTFAIRGNLTGPSQFSTSETFTMTYEDGSLMVYEDFISMAYE